MSRIVLLIIAVLAFIWLLRRALAARKPGAGADPTGRPVPPAPELVACAHCGVHLPKNDAVANRDAGTAASGRYYCSEEHLRLGPE